MTNAVGRSKAIRLRIEERLSLTEIQKLVPVSKGTLSVWLRDYPLNEVELAARRLANGQISAEKRRRENGKAGEPSSWFRIANTTPLASDQKGRIAEAAILFRLVVHGFTVLRSVFEGHTTDWLVETRGRLLRVQVKWARQGPHGKPIVSLRSSASKTTYTRADFDFLVGYDLFSDTAHVFSWEDIGSNTAAVTVVPGSLEAWHKLLDVV